MSGATLCNGPEGAYPLLLLAHGAGAGMETDFLTSIAEGVAAHGIRVVRFEFPYMQQRRVDGRRRPPNSAKVMKQSFCDQIAAHGGGDRCVIGGKSMGGRIATLVAQDVKVKGLVCLGYPFHPPGKPDKLRTEHLRILTTETLIVQGTRDSLGNRQEVAGYPLSPAINVRWLEDGDHSFKPRKSSGYRHAEHLATAVEEVARFVTRVSDTQKGQQG